jgi:hypothetical protein
MVGSSCHGWVEHADDDAPDPPLDNALDAWDLRAVPRRARLQRREQRCASERLVCELPLKKSEFSVFTSPEL